MTEEDQDDLINELKKVPLPFSPFLFINDLCFHLGSRHSHSFHLYAWLVFAKGVHD
jgi:hypothetical protein